jgi:Flp pilus assembly protein TadG
MVLGMIEFGRMIMVEQILTNATREGARLAVLDSPTPLATTVNNAVNSYLQKAGITSGATITLNPSEPTSAAYGDDIIVTVQVPFGNVTWLPSTLFISSTTKLKASTVMRRETVQ